MSMFRFSEKRENKQPDQEPVKTRTLLFGDVRTEGKKRGYERAAREYEQVLTKIAKEYDDGKNRVSRKKAYYDKKINDLTDKLGQLEKERKRLEKELNVKLGLGLGEFEKSNAFNALSDIYKFSGIYSVFELVLKYRRGIFDREEIKGYEEAKAVYEKKMESMKKDLKKLKTDEDRETQKLQKIVNEILDNISEEEMKIADLKLALECMG